MPNLAWSGQRGGCATVTGELESETSDPSLRPIVISLRAPFSSRAHRPAAMSTPVAESGSPCPTAR